MGPKGATLPKASLSDFGWLLRGRPVDQLADRSFDLAASPDSSFLKPYCLDLATLQACLQCGACTATCDLAGEEGLFPRRQVTFVRLGLQDRLAADQEIWHCYGCTECSSQCPSNAKPASIMSALRQFATDRYAYPRRTGARRQQSALLLACLPRHCRFPCRDDRRHWRVQSRPRAYPLCRDDPRLGAHPRVLGPDGPAADRDSCRRIQGLERRGTTVRSGRPGRGSSAVRSVKRPRRSSHTGSSPPARSAG